MRRLIVLASVVLLGGSASWLFGAQQPAPAAPTLDLSNFTGLVTPHATTDIRMNRYTFSAGARSNWHSHAAGQVLLAEKGRLRTQEQGKPVLELVQGGILRVDPNVVHWHGALPTEPVTQISLSFGATNWMAKVTDQEYSGKR